MADFVEKSGSTVEEAIEAALSALHIQRADGIIEVLEEPSRGFLGLIGKRPARVRVRPKAIPLPEEKEAEQTEKAPVDGANESGEAIKPAAEESFAGKAQEEEEPAAEEAAKEREEPSSGKMAEEAPRSFAGNEKSRAPVDPDAADAILGKAENFLGQIFRAMELKVGMERKVQQSHVELNLSGHNLGILIGKHGQTLDALQYLVNLAANQGMTEERVRILLDIEGYRSRREETLRHLAARLAERCCRTNQRIVLEPMNRHERKIIHMALQENRRVLTYSAGDEPFRKVVIEPKHRVSRMDGQMAEEDY